MATGDKKIIQITGRVIERKTRQGLANLRVEAWDKDLIVKNAIGNATTDQQGAFVIEVSKGQVNDLFANRHCVLFFKVFRDGQLVTSTEASVLWDRDAQDPAIVIKTTIDSQDPPNTGNALTLSGQVHHADLSVFTEGFVQAFITFQGVESFLGETKPDSNGQFEIAYSLSESQAGQLANLQVKVRVFDSDRTQLAESPSFIPDTTVPVSLTVPNRLPPAGEEQCVVSGRVLQPNGKPLSAGIVRVYGALPKVRQLEGAMTTISAVDEGHYRIEYKPKEFSVRLSDANRVEVRVFRMVASVEQELAQVADKRVQFHADAEEFVDISLQEKFDEPPVSTKTFTVEGDVTKDGLKLGNVTVKAFDGSSASSPFRTVQSSRDSSNVGHYVITYLVGPKPSDDFTSAPNLVIRAFDGTDVGENVLGRTALQNEIMNVTIPVSPPIGDFFVEGRVRSGTYPVPFVFVQAIDLFLARTVLGEQLTPTDGSYHISYHLPPGSMRDRANLLMRVFRRASNNVETDLLPTELFIENANPHLTLDDIDIPGLIKGPSEYEDISGKVAAVFPGLDPADLTDAAVELVVRNYNLDPQRGVFFAAAAKLARRTEILPEAHYAFLREGLPGNVTALLSQDPLVLRGALKHALDANIIPQHLQIDTIMDQLQKAIIAEAFRTGDTGLSSLGDLLATVITALDLQRKFVTLYVQHTGTIEQFWSSLVSTPGFGANIVNDLQFAIQAGALTGNHIPLVRKLLQMRAAKPPQITSLRDLARKTPMELETIIRQSAVTHLTFPPGIAGSNDNEKVANYARILSTILADAFPTAVISARFANDAGLNVPNKADVNKFFSNNPSFEIGGANVRTFIGQNTTNLTGIADRNGLTTRLEAMQRINKLSPSYADMSALMASGFDSAAGIARLSKETFIARYSTQLGGRTRAAVIFDNARQVAATTANLFADLNDRFSGAGTSVIMNTTPEAAGIPDWATLFGPIDFCECQQCRSVLSPAAYLVDILQFLKHRTAIDTARSALDVLFDRRSDIGEIELTCENTNDPIPYVDLVIELFQSNTASVDLSSQVYPWGLPFNQPTEQSRAYLDLLGVHRYDLMRTFQGASTSSVVRDPEEISIESEYLGMTTRERKIIAGSTDQISTLWGYTGGFPAVEGFIAVQELLDRSGLSHAELVDLLDTRYVNPNPTAMIDIQPDSTGEIMKMSFNPSMDEQALGRIIRFVRLWRRLGWTMHEVDLTITAVGAGNIDETFIAKLADVVRVKAALNLKVDQVLGLWSPIDTEGETSLYNRLFLNKKVTDPVDPAFQLNTQGSQLAATSPLKDHIPAILAALRVSTADLDLMRKAAGLTDPLPPGPPIVMDLANLSTLYRYSLLSRGLSRLSISDLIALKTLSRVDPFLHPPATKGFIEMFEKVRASGFKIAELKYLLRGESDAASPVAPTDDGIALVLDEIRKGLQKIAGETAEASDPSGEILAKKLASLGVESTLVDQVRSALAGSQIQSVPLNRPITTPTFSELLDSHVNDKPRGKLTYDGPTNELRFVGVMTQSESTSFSLLISNADYHDAIEALASEPPTRTYATPLAAPPPTLSDLPSGKPAYDATTGMLKFTGVMSTTDRDSLLSKSNDPDYQGAIGRLFAAPEGTTFAARLKSQLPESLGPLTPSAVSIRAELGGRISYDPAASRLVFTGVLTERESETLQAFFATDSDYQAAVSTLFNSPREFIKRQLKFFVVPRSAVRLEAALPAFPNSFPPELRSKISYDATTKVLQFTGEMTEPERDTLAGLSSIPEYVSAINTLFSEVTAISLDGNNQFLTGADVDQLFDIVSPAQHKFEFVLARVNAYLRRTSSESLIKQKLAEALKLDAQTTERLLTAAAPLSADDGRLKSPAHPSENPVHEFLDAEFIGSTVKITRSSPFLNQFDTFILLHKVALVVSKFKMTPRQLDWLFDYGLSAGWLDLNSFASASATNPASFSLWLRLVDLFALRDRLRNGEETLSTIFALSREPSPPVTSDVLLAKLSEMTGWDLDDLTFLDGPTGLALSISPTATNPKFAYTDERALTRLSDCFAMMRRLGVSARQCRSWAAAEMTPLEGNAARQAAKAKFDDEQWAEADQPISEGLSEKLRAALVSYMVAHPDPIKNQHWKDSNGLYDYFLIDPEMSPCMMTSRIKQAIGSVQLFVQRCLMNLEPGVNASAENDGGWRDWKWMKSYRVWEANRKVFLYPENWVEPELRDDKSPFFKDLENELLQNDITTDTAETAFINYLDKLHTVARLEVVGMVHQLDKDETGHTVIDAWHVFGRTFNTPHVYYFRRWIDQSYWTAWEKVDLDIQGEHVFPVIWNRRLYLFWGLFTEATEGKQDDKVPDPGAAVVKDLKFWKIQIAWSGYKNGKWQAKNLSKDALDTKLIETSEIALQSRFSFSAFFRERTLTITCFWDGPESQTYPMGTFEFDACDGAPRIRPASGFEPSIVVPPYWTVSKFMKLEEWNDADRQGDSLFLVDDTSQSREVLQKTTGVLPNTPGIFRLLFTHDEAPSAAQDALFFEDATRTFFVTSRRLAKTKEGFTAGNAVSPGSIDNTVSSYYITSGLSSGVGAFSLASIGLQAAATSLQTTAPPGLRGSVTGVNVITGGSGVFDPYPRSVLPTPKGTRVYRFRTFYHPYVCLFLTQINSKGIGGLLRRFVQTAPGSFIVPPPDQTFDFNSVYAPVNDRFTSARMVDSPFPREDVDFEDTGAYSLYNWELFFHAPLRIADALRKNQRFEDAQKWFHYIFDPTSTDDREKPSDTTSPAGDPKTRRYWQTKPFFQRAASDYDKQRIDKLLTDSSFADDLQGQIKRWRANPFNPHAIARLRGVAYQKTVVMKYLDNLIEWGDQLFSRDTIESINEATQLYILAAELLGPRPQEINPRTEPVPQTYIDLASKLDAFPNALENISPAPSTTNIPSETKPPLLLQVFCIPKNDKLLGYWDTVADRVFKIRHCQNIEGVARQLALFEPPIDPALLVRAAAAGIDIGSALSDINAPLPHYRFNVILQKASDLCAEVKALGGALLSALEKRDAEDLALLRSSLEIELLNAVRLVKQSQIDEASESLAGLKESKHVIELRRDFYRDIQFINASEQAHLDLSTIATILQVLSQYMDLAAGGVATVPDAYAGGAGGFGSPLVFTHLAGGSKAGSVLQAFGRAFAMYATLFNSQASMSATMGGYQRRFQDWKLQERLANKELDQVDNQITAAEIRLDIAGKEFYNHDKQISNAKEADEFMRDKFTNRELYDWMVGQISAIYFQSYKLAYDVAKRSERAFRFELGLEDSNFIQFGYWDSLKKGLLAGECLSHDLKRMEIAYLDQNKREYELTKHISLVLLDPIALIKLKETGRCFVNLEEALFDMDYPGHYMRRIKSVALTVPCVTGPYTSVNCTLTLLKNSVRSKTTNPDEYTRKNESDPSTDSRFRDSVGAIQSIATSGGQNDSGLFELNFRDERYLPFEGAGAISTWQIELPKDTNAFDFDTISDVILQLRYTARDGGAALQAAASKAAQLLIADAARQPLARLFSLRHEFPTEWHRFVNQTRDHKQKFAIDQDRFPFHLRTKTIEIGEVQLFVLPKVKPASRPPDSNAKLHVDATSSLAILLTSDGTLGGILHGKSPAVTLPPGEWSLEIAESDFEKIKANLDDIILVVKYSAT